MGIILLNVILTICMPGIFSWLTFFKINFFKNFFQELYQNVKQFGSKSGLAFWVQNIYKYHQQTAKFAAGRHFWMFF